MSGNASRSIPREFQRGSEAKAVLGGQGVGDRVTRRTAPAPNSSVLPVGVRSEDRQ